MSIDDYIMMHGCTQIVGIIAADDNEVLKTIVSAWIKVNGKGKPIRVPS